MRNDCSKLSNLADFSTIKGENLWAVLSDLVKRIYFWEVIEVIRPLISSSYKRLIEKTILVIAKTKLPPKLQV